MFDLIVAPVHQSHHNIMWWGINSLVFPLSLHPGEKSEPIMSVSYRCCVANYFCFIWALPLFVLITTCQKPESKSYLFSIDVTSMCMQPSFISWGLDFYLYTALFTLKHFSHFDSNVWLNVIFLSRTFVFNERLVIFAAINCSTKYYWMYLSYCSDKFCIIFQVYSCKKRKCIVNAIAVLHVDSMLMELLSNKPSKWNSKIKKLLAKKKIIIDWDSWSLSLHKFLLIVKINQIFVCKTKPSWGLIDM